MWYQARAASTTVQAGRDYRQQLLPMPGYAPYRLPASFDGGRESRRRPSPPPPPPTNRYAPGERAAEMDFNGDGKPDYLLYNPSTRQTVIWYLNNNVLIGHAYGPTPWSGLELGGGCGF